jgi:uncharacterized membrane protein (UPF0127 family)
VGALVPIAMSLIVLASAACDSGHAPGESASPTAMLETTTVAVVGADGARQELTVELARTSAERSRGLMFREELAEDAGMLFLFREDTQTGFWMRNTLVPLSIAFIAADGTILEVQDMEPETTDLHRPDQTYRYALEVNQGWFAERGLGPGDSVQLPEDLPLAE